MHTLISDLGKYQKQKNLSDNCLAKEIKISQSTLSRVKRGERRIGGKVLQALMRIPELRQAVIAYMEGKE